MLALAGAAGLVLSVLGRERALAARLLGEPGPAWLVASPGLPWLVLQSVLVMVGAVSALMLSRWLSLVGGGILAGLVFVTPVGLLTTLPAVWMLSLVVPRFEAFWEFTPRWRGPGPPPPGQWKV